MIGKTYLKLVRFLKQSSLYSLSLAQLNRSLEVDASIVSVSCDSFYFFRTGAHSTRFSFSEAREKTFELLIQ